MIETLLNVFVLNPETSVVATDALSNLLLKRVGAREFAETVLDEVVRLLSRIVDENLPRHFLIFIMGLFTEYGPIIEEMCYGGDTCDQEMTDWVLSVCRLILSAANWDEYCDEFWALWRHILMCVYRCLNSHNKFDLLNPCLALYRDLIPEIRASLYIAFGGACEGGKLKSANCQTCWIYLASIDKEGMIEFLEVQRASSCLCFAIGLLDCCLSGTEEYELLLKVLPRLFEYHQRTSTVEFGTALLYMLSHSIRFLNRVHSFLVVFGASLVEFMNSPDYRVLSSACNAFLYVSIRHAAMLTKDPDPVFAVMQPHINGWIRNFDKKNSARVVKAVANIGAAQNNAESRVPIYNILLDSIGYLLSSVDHDTVFKGITLLNVLSTLSLPDAQPIFFAMLEQLIGLLNQGRENGDERLLQMSIETITAVICTFDFEPIKMVIDGFVGALLTLHDFPELALLAVSSLRMKFIHMEVFYDRIFKTHVEAIIPKLAETGIEAFAVLRFFRRFKKDPRTLNMVSEAAVRHLSDERIEVSREASKLLKSVLYHFYDQQELSDIVAGRSQLLGAMFTTLTDGFHLPVFTSVAKTLAVFFQVITASSYPVEKLDDDVVASLVSVCSDRQFLLDFAKYLRGCYADLSQFMASLREFLVAVKCASASDKSLFKRNIEMDTVMLELMNLVQSEEKSAIRAEELEILPALAALSIP
jgi:hypothetical protein